MYKTFEKESAVLRSLLQNYSYRKGQDNTFNLPVVNYSYLESLFPLAALAKDSIIKSFKLGDDLRREIEITTNSSDMAIVSLIAGFFYYCTNHVTLKDSDYNKLIKLNTALIADAIAIGGVLTIDNKSVKLGKFISGLIASYKLDEAHILNWVTSTGGMLKPIDKEKVKNITSLVDAISVAVNSIKSVKKKFILTANPYDFLLSSHEVAPKSCHNLNSRYHGNGNSAYISDNFSLMLFSVDNKAPFEFPYSKISRAWVYVSSELTGIVICRLFGTEIASNELKNITESLIKIIDDTTWNIAVGGKNSSFNMSLLREAILWKDQYGLDLNDRNPMYVDTELSTIASKTSKIQNPSISTSFKYLNLKPAICLECGRETTKTYGMICNLCEHSLGSCGICATRIDTKLPIINKYNGIDVCKICEGSYIKECKDCGVKLFTYKNVGKSFKYFEVKNVYSCYRCYQKTLLSCCICKTAYEEKDLRNISGKLYCYGCNTSEKLLNCNTCNSAFIMGTGKSSLKGGKKIHTCGPCTIKTERLENF